MARLRRLDMGRMSGIGPAYRDFGEFTQPLGSADRYTPHPDPNKGNEIRQGKGTVPTAPAAFEKQQFEHVLLPL